jgi:hypothetical protein
MILGFREKKRLPISVRSMERGWTVGEFIKKAALHLVGTGMSDNKMCDFFGIDNCEPIKELVQLDSDGYFELKNGGKK